MKTENLSSENENGNNANTMLVAGRSKIKRIPWNKGKRKPIIDEWGDKWCNCEEPKLTSPVTRGDAWCLKCMCAWHH